MSETTQVTLEGKKKECEHLILVRKKMVIFGQIMKPEKNEAECVVCNKRFDLDKNKELAEKVGKVYDGKIIRWLYNNNFVFAINHLEFELDFTKNDQELVQELRDKHDCYHGIMLEKREFHSAEKLREAIRKELETNPAMRPTDFVKKYSQRYWNLSYGRVASNFRKVKE